VIYPVLKLIPINALLLGKVGLWFIVRPTTPRGPSRLDGARGKEPDVFRKQMYDIEESTCDIVGTFRHPPQWFGTREIVASFPTRYAPNHTWSWLLTPKLIPRFF